MINRFSETAPPPARAGSAAAAAQTIEAIHPQSGQTVLVNGASGGVGSFAVQLLVARGVTVIATGEPAGADRLRSLGAAEVIDYTAGHVADQVRAIRPDGVDRLINLAGHSPADVPAGALRRGGVIATLGAQPDADTLAAHDLTSTMVMATAVREVVGPLAEKAAAGDLQVHVADVLPFEQAPDGLDTLATGHAGGKLVVTLDKLTHTFPRAGFCTSCGPRPPSDHPYPQFRDEDKS